MPEYIEREALLEDIGETVVFTVRNTVKLPTSEMKGANKIIDRIWSAPTADVVEVVRCKDCENCNKNSFCSIIDKYVTANGYCSNGERKGE